MITAYQAAEMLQTAFCNKRDDGIFNVSHILGADWNTCNGFKDSNHYCEVVYQKAKDKFGALPFNPFASFDE